MNKINKYLSFVKENYSDFRYFSDYNALNNLSIINKKHHIISNKDGFCIVFEDNLKDSLCYFGYLEIYSLENVSKFIDEIINFAKQIGKTMVIGPINNSVWNSYRFMRTNLDIIASEYETNPIYNELFINSGFKVMEKYITISRNNINPFKNNIDSENVTFEKQELNNGLIEEIYNLSLKIFDKAEKISLVEFEIYMKTYLDLYKNNLNIFLLKFEDKNIGFISSIEINDYFVIKTFGVLKEYRGNGYGNFIINKIYDYYFKKGIYKSYGIYMRNGEDVTKMSSIGATIKNEYYLYYKNI